MKSVSPKLFSFIELCVLAATAWFVINSFVQKGIAKDIDALIKPTLRNKSFLTYIVSMESKSQEIVGYMTEIESDDRLASDSFVRPDIKNFLLQILVRFADPKLSTLYSKCLGDRNYDTRLLGFIGLININEKVQYDPSIEYFLENSHDEFLLQMLLGYYAKVRWTGDLKSLSKHENDKNSIVRSLAELAVAQARGLK